MTWPIEVELLWFLILEWKSWNFEQYDILQYAAIEVMMRRVLLRRFKYTIQFKLKHSFVTFHVCGTFYSQSLLYFVERNIFANFNFGDERFENWIDIYQHEKNMTQNVLWCQRQRIEMISGKLLHSHELVFPVK